MAAIDKIYGTPKQWQQLYDFLETYKPEYLRYLYPLPEPLPDEREIPVSNFSYEADKWLRIHCPLSFVINRLNEQYRDGEP